MLGMTYRKAKIVGLYGVGRNYIMMKLEEVGRVPKDQIAIQRMVVLTGPSSCFYQLSFHQHLLRFFLNRFLGTLSHLGLIVGLFLASIAQGGKSLGKVRSSTDSCGLCIDDW